MSANALLFATDSEALEDYRRLWEVARVPWEVLEYERWVTQGSPNEDYLFAEAKARFEAVDDDRLLCLPDLEIEGPAAAPKLHARKLNSTLSLTGLSSDQVQRWLGAIDGRRTLAELRARVGSSGPPLSSSERARERVALDAFLKQTLGSVVFAPDALAELERRIPGTELVRYVGTPYEIVRSYWENAAEVRELLEPACEQVRDGSSFLEALRALHVVGLMGKKLDRFYRPASKVTLSGVRPGTLFTAETRVLSSTEGALLLSGPRVGANYLGGATYHQLLTGESAPEAEPHIVDEDGLDWGRVLHARAPHEERATYWFLPPRPLRPQHFERLWQAYAAARAAGAAGDYPVMHLELARFHYRFARLHPFRCANQSLSMNLVNSLLHRHEGEGIPHLLLDHTAFRIPESRYPALFQRALASQRGLTAGIAPARAAERWHYLRTQKSLAYGLIQRLQAARDLRAAHAECRANPEAARAALIDLDTIPDAKSLSKA